MFFLSIIFLYIVAYHNLLMRSLFANANNLLMINESNKLFNQ